MFDRHKIAEVDPQEAERLRAEGAVLLDVREEDEWAAGHAPGAVHVPLAGVGQAAATFGSSTVLAVCRSGGRSAKAAKTLAADGATVRNVTGGMTAWAAAGLPVVRDDGSKGTIS